MVVLGRETAQNQGQGAGALDLGPLLGPSW